MLLIKVFKDELNYEKIYTNDICDWLRKNQKLGNKGYRLFENGEDVTEKPERLAVATNLDAIRPAKTGLESVVIYALVAAAVSVAVVLLMPIPEAPVGANRSQSSATNSLGGRTNEPNVGGRVDDIWGRVNRHVPRLMQVPHFRFEDNVETEHFALYLSMGKGLIENVRDGDTDFSRLNNSKFNAWNPGGNPNNGVAADYVINGEINRPLVNIRQSAELQSSELLPPNDLSGGVVTWFLTGNGNEGTITATSEEPDFDMQDYFTVGDEISFSDTFYFYSTGLVELFYIYTYWSEGEPVSELRSDSFQSVDSTDLSSKVYQVTSVLSDSVEVSFSGGVGDPVYDAWQEMSNYKLESLLYDVSSTTVNFKTLDPSIQDRDYRADASYSILIETSIQYFNPSISQQLSGGIGPYQIDTDIDSITFNVVADSGFYKLVSNNETIVTAEFELIVEETNSSGVISGNRKIYPFELTSNQPNLTTQAAVTVDQEMNDYEYQRISFRRLTRRDKSSSVSNVDKAILRDLYLIKELDSVPDYTDITVAQVSIESSPASRGVKERQVNLDWTRIINPYIGNGNFGAEQPVDTVAETIIAISLDKYNGRLTLDEIDADLFLSVQQQLIEYYGTSDFVKIGYDLDSTKLRFQEIYGLMWDAVRCNAYSFGAVYKVYPNIKRDDSSKQFTHRNKIVGTDNKERTYDIESDGVELTYRSNKTGQFEEIILHVDGISSNNRLKIELSGATQEIQARTRAEYELNILKFQKFSYSFEADGISRLTVPGERVDNVDQTRIVRRDNNQNTYSIYDGKIAQINGLSVELSQPVYFTSGETHTIRFTDQKGKLMEAIECEPGDSKYHVNLKSQPSQSLYDGYKMEKTAFTFCADRERDSLPIIVLGTKPKVNKGLKTRQLSGINYDERYFSGDVI